MFGWWLFDFCEGFLGFCLFFPLAKHTGALIPTVFVVSTSAPKQYQKLPLATWLLWFLFYCSSSPVHPCSFHTHSIELSRYRKQSVRELERKANQLKTRLQLNSEFLLPSEDEAFVTESSVAASLLPPLGKRHLFPCSSESIFSSIYHPSYKRWAEPCRASDMARYVCSQRFQFNQTLYFFLSADPNISMSPPWPEEIGSWPIFFLLTELFISYNFYPVISKYLCQFKEKTT